MVDDPNPPRGRQGDGWTHSVWVPLLAAGIIGLAGIAGALIGRSTVSETTTVVRTVPAPEPEPLGPVEPEPEPPTSSQPGPGSPPSDAVACLPSSAESDAQDNSMGSARGPLASSRVYRGTLIKGDQEWWGFCVRRPGRVDVKFENVCSDEESGATNVIAEILDSSGEQLESFRPDPGRFESIPLRVEADTPYYIHIWDLHDVDVGGEICGEVPWALTVTGDLTSKISS